MRRSAPRSRLAAIVRPRPPSGLEASVAAPVEEQGTALLAHAQVEDPAHDEEVVAGVVHGLDAGLDPAQHLVQDGGPGPAPPPTHPRELVLALGGEHAADVLLSVAQDVDAEVLRLLDPGPRRGRAGGREPHQGRVHRQRHERLAGEPDRAVLVDRGDDRDAGGEMPEDLAEVGLLEGGRAGPGDVVGVDGSHTLRCRPSAAASTSSKPAMAPRQRAPSSRPSMRSSSWAGSWWKRARRRAPASLATSTA